jgi:hypothetical protein
MPPPREHTVRVLIAVTFLSGAILVAQNTPKSTAGEIWLTYLGQAGYEITDGKTVVLVDPVLTMTKLRRDNGPGNFNLGAEIKGILQPDTAESGGIAVIEIRK